MVKKPKLGASRADAPWEERIDGNLCGADTDDYSMHADARSKRH
jgi:hypothetical protein